MFTANYARTPIQTHAPLPATASVRPRIPAGPLAPGNRRHADACTPLHAPRPRSAPGWLVAPFAPISLTQLNAKADMLERRDNKYVVSGSVLKRAMGELARHFDILEIDGERDFTYDTCYFDDPDHTGYFDHHRGRRIRCKVRMRKYVDAGLCFVEVKLKHVRGMTIKERRQVPLDQHGRLDAGSMDFIGNAYRALYGREFTPRLQPVIEMQYQRVTLVAKEGGERMTVDIGMTFKGNGAVRQVDEDLYLVETKSRNANGIADKILRGLHQHPTNSCSKYCIAMAALKKVGKYNKFLVALRRLGMLPAGHAQRLSAGASASTASGIAALSAQAAG